MSGFRGFGLSLSNEDPVAVTVALAAEADRLGFDEVSIPESRLFRSVTSVAAAALVATEHVVVRIGIANPVFRSPVVLALEAATLADIGGGRLRFGVGAADWTVRALGMEPDGWRPFSQTVEAVRAIRNLTAGETLGFSPTTFDASSDLRLDLPPATAVPVDVGAVSRRMMEASGEHADGVQLGAITSVAYTRWATERLAVGAARAGRDPSDLLVSGNVLTSVARDRRAARNAVRPVLAYYLARVEGVVVTESGADPDAVRVVREAVLDKGVDAGAAIITEDLIDVFAAAGTVDDVVAALAPYAEAGLDLPLAWYTFGPDQAEAIRIIAEQVRPVVVAARP